MEYLPYGNQVATGTAEAPLINAAGKHVVIIGGGDTGADCLGTALRQGALSVTQLEIAPEPPTSRSSQHPWPTYPLVYRVSSAHEEGGERRYQASTQAFIASQDDGQRVGGLQLVDVEFVDGIFTPVAGTEQVIPADLVLLAMGFTGVEENPLFEQLGIQLDARGNISRDANWQTNVDGVFVAGDAGRGQSLIVWAIAEGRAAAASVDAYLSGESELPSPVVPTSRSLTA
jgi:glutamate synthase (NADPH/NADH) small chain